jgi:periplasmic protein TonB
MVDAEPQRLLAPPLPALAPQRRTAWVVSLAAHVAVLGLGIWLVHHAVTQHAEEPVRMVYVEPVPPPPPPLGAPLSPAGRAPAVPEPVVERPEPIHRAPRLVVPRKAKRAAAPSPVPAVVPRGEPEGATGGVVGGVVGGEAGGKVGGVVGGHGDELFAAERVAHPPVVLSRVLPVYPPLARARGLEGRVVLRAVVDRTGHVEPAITVVESVPTFDGAAIEALRQWRFAPGRDHDGRLVRVLVDVPIRFQLR